MRASAALAWLRAISEVSCTKVFKGLDAATAASEASVSSTAVVSPARRASRAPASVSFIKSEIIPPPSAQQKIPHAHRAHWQAPPLADRRRSQHRPDGKAVAA